MPCFNTFFFNSIRASSLGTAFAKISSNNLTEGSKLSAKPCGPCRQIIHEYLGDIPIYISNGKDQNYETHSIKDLLPYPFG